MAAVTQATAPKTEPSREDETLLVLARLMEGGKEDDETIRDLDQLTKLLNDDVQLIEAKKGSSTICKLIDSECVDTILAYLDMRQPEIVRAHAIVATSAYLKAGGDDGAKKLSGFFFDKIKRGTYDDYILAFCVAAATFPVVPDLTTELFLSEGFLASLGPLMRRKWKSRKVETACLEMLNAACMNSQCRDAVNKYCTEWLEEVVDQDPDEIAKEMQQDPEYSVQEGSVAMRRHSEQVQNLAAVILAKLRAVPPAPALNEEGQGKISPAITTIEELSARFTSMLLSDDDHGDQHSIEGLAYSSIQPAIKEKLVKNSDFLKKLVKKLGDAPPKSPLTYGALSILVNLTRYQPSLSEEEKKMNQLKAYAAAAGKSAGPDPLNDNEHVAERCRRVFEAGVTPVLVTHSKFGSPASLALTVTIIYSLSVTTSLRGRLAQQGAVKLLLTAWATLPETETAGRRTAAQALARILISTNPSLVFGGSRSNPQSSAVRPLVSIIPPDPASEHRDLLPTFEALMALTNLASNDDIGTRQAIIRAAWPHIEDQLLCSNARVSKAAVELICNLVQSVEGLAQYADGSPQAKARLHILLALADAEDEGTRSAAGGALAALTAHENVVQAVVDRERGVKVILDMCADDNEGLRHRGGFIIYNMVAAEGAPGANARRKIIEEDGLEVLKEAAKKSRLAEVVEVLVQALKVLLEDSRALEG
ncbi:actin cytoskeleton organization protein [Colletotrichum plurivorum]|uniref:Actin cytoskeleton organization protein n=1 Tax=Colletotrichum plurivorum TaxID=2175906 RepID=A0A8H6NQ05_9PEZI|nr:actin cytoskeleton organization protein [Colletotrichum plurivorum]